MKQSVFRQLTNLNSLLAVAEGLLLLEPREGLEKTPAENPASTHQEFSIIRGQEENKGSHRDP